MRHGKDLSTKKYDVTMDYKKDIVILTVKTEESYLLYGLRSIGEYRVSSEIGSGGIFFTSARKFKGLESGAVILVDVDEKTFKSEEERRVFYVGASRAKHFLDVFSDVKEEDMLKFSEAITGTKNKNPKAAIGSGLKVKILNEII